MDDLKNAIESYGGIQPPHMAFYMESIRFNLDAAYSSIVYVADFIDMTNQSNGEYEMTRELTTAILDNIQNILTNAAALSRYFWPSRDGKNNLHAQRAITLKKYIGIDDSSPLKNRKLRNQLEHFDENLDKHLWAKPIVGVITPSYVGCEFEDNGVPNHFFRAFFIDTGIFETLGVRYEIQPIVDELCVIYSGFNRYGT